MTLFSWFENKDHTNNSPNNISKESTYSNYFDNCTMWPTAQIKLGAEVSIRHIPRKTVEKAITPHIPVINAVLNTKKI